MKRSKLFLTGSLLIMAIAGVAATKGMKRDLPSYYYQVLNAQGNPQSCVFVNQRILCEVGSPVCKYVVGSASYQEYANRQSAAICINPLQPD